MRRTLGRDQHAKHGSGKVFVEYLLIRISAEFELRIASLVRIRCSRSRDRHLRSFAQKQADHACKRFDISDLVGLLARFGEDYKKCFRDKVMNGLPHVAWSNIYVNRVATAHKAGSQMSLGDLKREYRESLKVIDALVEALGLKENELRDLN